jgi:hypothetical protein
VRETRAGKAHSRRHGSAASRPRSHLAIRHSFGALARSPGLLQDTYDAGAEQGVNIRFHVYVTNLRSKQNVRVPLFALFFVIRCSK